MDMGKDMARFQVKFLNKFPVEPSEEFEEGIAKESP